jgi:hypothetical protein
MTYERKQGQIILLALLYIYKNVRISGHFKLKKNSYLQPYVFNGQHPQ